VGSIAYVEHSNPERSRSVANPTGGDGEEEMSATEWMPERVANGRVGTWLPVCLRVVAVVLVLPSAVLKVVDYGGQAAIFVEYGVPAAGVTVLVVAAVEASACLAVASGVATRFAAFVLTVVMVAAMAFYAVVPSNTAVLVASLGLVALGPGPYAVWDPEDTVFGRFPAGT
jgi:uncharacterized membrane protein YphA (DoxX/SURF4 family)